MTDNEFYTPTDMDALRMENELLAFEVRFLKARMGHPGGVRGSSTSLNRLSSLEEAERDLVLLLRRMSTSWMRPLLRRSESFRALERRYLHSPEAHDSPSSPRRIEYLEGAEKDLVLLLRRMGAGPQSRLLRLNKNFRTLEQRYL